MRDRSHPLELLRQAAGLGLRVSAPDAAVLAVTVGESARAVRAKKTCAAYGVRGRACLTESDFATAARALAAVTEHDES
jgi:hypothetical protein